MYVTLIVIRSHIPSCTSSCTVYKSYHHVFTTPRAMRTFGISWLFRFISAAFVFCEDRIRIPDRNFRCRSEPSVIVSQFVAVAKVRMNMVLLKRFVAYKTCLWYRKLWTTSYLCTTFVLKGRSATWNESEVQSSEPTSVRRGLTSASCMWFPGWPRKCLKIRVQMIWKPDDLLMIFAPLWVMTASTALYIQKQCAADFNPKGKLRSTIWATVSGVRGQIPLKNPPKTSILKHKSCAPCQTQLWSYINKHLVVPNRYLYNPIHCIPYSLIGYHRIPSAKPSTFSSWSGLERVPTKNADHIYHGFLACFPTTPNDKKWWRTSHFASFSPLPTKALSH